MNVSKNMVMDNMLYVFQQQGGTYMSKEFVPHINVLPYISPIQQL